MSGEARGAAREAVEIGGAEFRPAIGAQHVPVEAVEQDDDGVLGSRRPAGLFRHDSRAFSRWFRRLEAQRLSDSTEIEKATAK